MNDETKAGKKCPNPVCVDGKYGDYLDTCDFCHGIGWLPQPGDALTHKEAETIYKAQVLSRKKTNLEYYDLNFKEWLPWHGERRLTKFRLAPEPEDNLGKEVMPHATPGVTREVEATPEVRPSGEAPTEPYAAKHAEEVAAKDAEIERLKLHVGTQAALAETRGTTIDELQAEIYAARERAEKAVALVEFYRALFPKEMPMPNPLDFPKFVELNRAYDASRAADKEGA